MGRTYITLRCLAVVFVTETLLLVKVSGFGMRPKGLASSSSSSFNLLTSSLDLSSSSSDVAAAERNLLAFIRSCTGATSNAALGCPCAGNGKRCKDSLSICRNFKCSCDSSISTYNSASNKCIAIASVTTTTTKSPVITTTIPVATTTTGSTSGTVKFSQTSYTFSTTVCTAGTIVGTVSATNAIRYTISNAQFIISAAGQITMQSALSAGSYSAAVTGFGATGSSATATVTITVGCGGSTPTCAASPSPTYTGATTCSAAYPGELGYPPTASLATAADITVILDTHNNYRRIVGATNMRQLKWDPCLASSAQAWANMCNAATPHDTYAARIAPGFPQGCGQNKASGSADFLTWKSAIDLWYSEVKDFTYCGSNNVFSNVGHYTQVMWAETSLIGCGFAKCSGTDVFMCNYCTAGNFGSEPAIYCDLLYKQGQKCSACSTPAGSGCATGDCLCA